MKRLGFSSGVIAELDCFMCSKSKMGKKILLESTLGLKQWSTIGNILILEVIRKGNNCKYNFTKYGNCFVEVFF